MNVRDFSARDLGLLVAALALVLDQGSKQLLLYGFGFAEMGPHQAIKLLPFLNLVMVWNPGISLGLFPADSPEGAVLLATLQLMAVFGLSWWLWRTKAKLLAMGIGLVVGGALGNLLDRLVYGRVADFFHFHVQGYDFYVFNVADTAITFGVVALLYDALMRKDEPAPPDRLGGDGLGEKGPDGFGKE